VRFGGNPVAIELNRRFVECRDNEESDPDLVARFARTDSTLGWTDLLRKRRVVFLAEAGSGKTTEMITHAREQAEAGRASFYVSLEDVGRQGLGEALRPVDRPRFAAWRASDQEAWFFIDSIDEAKHSGVRLRTALRAIADAIVAAERRAHVILSGRYTDWQFRQDLAQLTEELAIPADQTLPNPPTPDELVISTIHRERPTPPPSIEEPLVVVMTGLDKERIRLFASGKKVRDLDVFLEQIEAANLWQFARRPLDLDWLVQFWHSHNRLGSLAEMLDVCIAERLRESNLDRARQDGLDEARSTHAIERIGAALVFCGKATVAVPDTEIALTADSSSLDIADVLPDWSAQDRTNLLTRAVFDPATLGRVRLHNDNQGVVRSYLAARWLQNLRKANLSQQSLFDLLFAETYGLKVIKPSMQEVAAWLSLSDENVAREVARREPFLLLTAGDPATLSRQTREGLLTQVVERIVAGDHIPLLDYDSLKRFSRPDLALVLRGLWEKHAAHDDARHFLLRVIWLGEIRECSGLSSCIALGPMPDRHTSIVAGRALMATADDATKNQYAKYVKANCRKLSTTVVWDAIEKLFPHHIAIDDLIAILSLVNVTDRDGGLGLDWHGPKLIERLSSPSDLEHLLQALLSQLGGTVAAGDREQTDREKAYFPMIAAAAHRLLELCPVDQAPVSAIDAAARLGESARTSRPAREVAGDLVAELQRSSARRRCAFWHFSSRLAGHRMLGGRPIDSAWDLQMLGWSVRFLVEDLDWLLADGPKRIAENERRLAINTAMMIWRDANSLDVIRERIAAAANSDVAMTEAFDSWIKPRTRSSAEIESESELEHLQHRNAVERAARDNSWIEFAAKLRGNPDEMRTLQPTSARGVDTKLFHLWLLLSQTADADRHYAISTVAPLAPMIGAEATEAFRLALIAHWRAWDPWLRSTRKDGELNQMRSLDCMGIAGVTLEANGDAGWADGISSDDARRAAAYATLELSGFPGWLALLARTKPNEVRAVLSQEVLAELDRPWDVPRFGVLQDIARGDSWVAELMAPIVLGELHKRSVMPTGMLSQMLDTVTRGLAPERNRVKTLALARFTSSTDPAIASLYIGAVFEIDGEAATAAVLAKLDQISPADRPALVQRVLPHVFGDHFSAEKPTSHNLPLHSLERLVRLAFEIIHVADDNVHPSNEAYSPDDRDRAESARSAAFGCLVNSPGRAAFDAILRFANVPDFPVPTSRLQDLARERAAKDSETALWKPGEMIAFERSAETEPQTPRDLQIVAQRRLADMQYDLLHDDFQQGETLAVLANEKAVQKWVADRVRLKQGRSYSVEREVHVADEKEPDVRLRAKATDASVPIEVKVAESWTLEQLEAALTKQLCGKYLRAREGRHGILLLVHQKSRPQGWPKRGGAVLTFAEVVNHLRGMAIAICGSELNAPQPEVAVLDVSTFGDATAATPAKPSKRSPPPIKRRA
jgi:hypothetical protein